MEFLEVVVELGLGDFSELCGDWTQFFDVMCEWNT